jgi:hypothetical protein
MATYGLNDNNTRVLARSRSREAHAEPLKSGRRSPTLPVFFCATSTAWFNRVQRGIYELTPEGTSALARWPQPAMAAVAPLRSCTQPADSRAHFELIVPLRGSKPSPSGKAKGR